MVSKTTANTLDILKANLKEGVKTYHQYDGQSRVEAVWEAPLSKKVGEPCLLTIISYVGVTQQIASTREAVATWTAAMEAALPADPSTP